MDFAAPFRPERQPPVLRTGPFRSGIWNGKGNSPVAAAPFGTRSGTARFRAALAPSQKKGRHSPPLDGPLNRSPISHTAYGRGNTDMLRLLECNKSKHFVLGVRTPRLASRTHRTGPATEQTETQSTKHRAQNRGPLNGGRSVERTVRAKARGHPGRLGAGAWPRVAAEAKRLFSSQAFILAARSGSTTSGPCHQHP